MNMDAEENKWAKNLLQRKSMHDVGMMHHSFMITYSKVLDSTIRENCSKLCPHCRTGSGRPICKSYTGEVVKVLGHEILHHASEKTLEKAWTSFIESIEMYFKKDIMTFMKTFQGVCRKVDDRSVFSTYMCRHFPNPASNTIQVYFDYDDFDEVG